MEEPIVGLKAIAAYLFLGIEAVKKHSKDWQNKGLLIPRLVGRPPHRRRVILSYPSLLQKIRSD